MDRAKIKAQCKKLLEVSRHADAHPQEAKRAITLLDKLLKQYHIDITEIDPENTQEISFRYQTPEQKTILVGLYCKVCHRAIYSQYSKNRLLWFTCTKAQEIEIKRLYKIYREAWNEELKKFAHAFRDRHDLFKPENAEWADKEEHGKHSKGRKTEMSFNDMLDALMMAEGMADVSTMRELEK